MQLLWVPNSMWSALIPAVRLSFYSSSFPTHHYLGVGRSTPAVSFFDTASERALWAGNELTNVGSSPAALAFNWARYQIYGRLAEERDKTKDVLIHINTENTARDMLKITQAHGRDKLQYWGFSYVQFQRHRSCHLLKCCRYGTILGATFASILPVSSLPITLI